MSDSEEEAISKGVILNGVDNFSTWQQDIRAVLLGRNFNAFITSPFSVTLAKALSPYFPVDANVPTRAELAKAAEVEAKCEGKRAKAFGILFKSLSQAVRSRTPADKIDWDAPNPQLLYQYLVTEYGASSGTRQAELWSLVWESKVEEGENPVKKLLQIRTACAELLSSQKAGATAKDLIDSLALHAMLHSLPESFSLLASTILPNTDLHSEMVITTIQQEWRRRHISEESTTALLFRQRPSIAEPRQGKESGERERKKGKDGNWLYGPHENEYEYCDVHKAYGHRTLRVLVRLPAPKGKSECVKTSPLDRRGRRQSLPHRWHVRRLSKSFRTSCFVPGHCDCGRFRSDGHLYQQSVTSHECRPSPFSSTGVYRG